MTAAILLLGSVTIERLFELWLARRNTALLIGRGGVEVAPGHYPAIVFLHALWLAGLWLLGPARPLHVWWVAAFAILQILRFWTLAALGKRWTTRIIILPGEPLVERGPYRFVSHPNYLIVIGEIAVLPLCFGLSWYALGFSLANGVLLWVRIKAEEEALGR